MIKTGSLVTVSSRAGWSIYKWHFIPGFDMSMSRMHLRPEDFITVREPFIALYVCSRYVTKHTVRNKKTRRSGRKGRHVQSTKNTLWHLLTWGSERFWICSIDCKLTIIALGEPSAASTR